MTQPTEERVVPAQGSEEGSEGESAGTVIVAGLVNLAIAAALAALLLIGTHPAVAVAAVAVWGVLTGLLPPVFQTRMARIAAPGIRDVAGAVAITALNVGIAAGAALGGLVLARCGPTGLVLAAAGVAAAGALVLFVRRPAVVPGNDGAREAP